MSRPNIAWWVCCGLAVAALESNAASTPARPGDAVVNPEAEVVPDATQAPAPASAPSPQSKAATISLSSPKELGIPTSRRLRFRGPDGTCVCDCASGGISEADIRKAEEARRTASR